MDFDKIKKGDTVLIKGVVASKTEEFLYINFLGRYNERVSEYFHRTCLEHLECEPTLKHDPCRLFRKGDKVRLVHYRGRAPIMFGANIFSIGEIFTVEEDENKEYDVMVNGASHRQMCQACFLELVTPTEEQEPYLVSNDDYEYCVFNQRTKTTVCRFDISHPPRQRSSRSRVRKAGRRV